MHGDKIASPFISTYAAGGNTSRSPSRVGFFNGTIARPVIAILGAASAAAIVSVSFEGGAPVVTRASSSMGDPGADGSIHRPSANELAVVLPTEQPSEPTEDTRQDLPFLGVLSQSALEPVASSDSATRHLASRGSDLASRPVVRPAMLAPATSHQVPAPGAAFTSVATQSIEVAPAEAAPAIEELSAALVEPADGGAAIADGGALTANLESTAAPAVDEQSSALLERQGSLIPAAGELGADEAPLIAEESVATSVGEGEKVAIPEAAETGVADAVERIPAESARENTIPHHLARINERYPSTQAAEAASPDRASYQGAVLPAPAAASEAIRVDVTGSSTAIVQEDELVAIRLGELVSLLEDRFDHPLYVWMKSSAAASKFVTAETLAAAGIKTSYDPERKQIVISTSE